MRFKLEIIPEGGGESEFFEGAVVEYSKSITVDPVRIYDELGLIAEDPPNTHIYIRSQVKPVVTKEPISKDHIDENNRLRDEMEKVQALLFHADPDCVHEIVSGDNNSGIKCSKCPGWFCY